MKAKTMTTKEKAKNYDADKIIEKFNQLFPVGSRVRWRSVANDKMLYREYTVQYAAENHCGMPVAWFREKTGLVSVEPEFVDYGGAE